MDLLWLHLEIKRPAEWDPFTWHGYPDACHMPGVGIFPVGMA